MILSISSGRVIVAAAAVMVAVFLTFALSGPLAPKEVGVILAIAVSLDALCIRLIMLPAILHMAGDHAWTTPRWQARAGTPARGLRSLVGGP